MGKIKLPEKVKLFCGLIFNPEVDFLRVKEKIEGKIGKIDFEAGPFDFNFTDYYEKEMGKNLKRSFISIYELFPLDNLYKVKIFTNEIEKDFLNENGGRKVNIDPGYIDLSKVVLFSTKDYYHRIYIAEGIYAEVTLYYQEKDYRFFQWTYPDYRTENYLNFFRKIREIYKKQIKEIKK